MKRRLCDKHNPVALLERNSTVDIIFDKSNFHIKFDTSRNRTSKSKQIIFRMFKYLTIAAFCFAAQASIIQHSECANNCCNKDRRPIPIHRPINKPDISINVPRPRNPHFRDIEIEIPHQSEPIFVKPIKIDDESIEPEFPTPSKPQRPCDRPPRRTGGKDCECCFKPRHHLQHDHVHRC